MFRDVDFHGILGLGPNRQVWREGGAQAMASRDTTRGAPAQATFLHQHEPIDDLATAARALVGACLLGALDHWFPADERRTGTRREAVTLAELRHVFSRRDDGVHGCGFEWAVHEAVNGAAGIPEPIRRCVVDALAAEVGGLFESLGVPHRGWVGGLRSVSFGQERRHHPGHLSRVADELGAGALIWSAPGQRPRALLPLLEPASRPPGSALVGATPYGGKRRRAGGPSVHLPEAVGFLFQTDLFLGGATLAHTPAIDMAFVGLDELGQRRALAAPTAWVAASVKWRYRVVTGGPGLHLGIETTHGDRSALRADPRTTRRVGPRGLPVVTLPLDGDFVFALREAYYILETTLGDMPRRPHPKHMVGRWQTQLAAELHEQRTTPAWELARRLLDAQAGLVDVVTAPRAGVDGTGPTQGALLIPVPQMVA